MRRVGGGECKAGDRGLFELSRNVFVLGIVSFFNDLSSEMVYPLFPTFITEFLGAGAWFLGLVEGLADSIASLLNLFSGWVSDRFRRRKSLVVAGYSVSGLSRGSLALVTAPWQAAAAWFCNRVGKGPLPFKVFPFYGDNLAGKGTWMDSGWPCRNGVVSVVEERMDDER